MREDNDFTFASALAACSRLVSIRNGKQAHGIFNKMEHRNLVSWNTMILFGNHGFRRKAGLLVKMKTTGVKPDFVTLIDLLGRAGRLKEAEEYMKKFPFGHDPFVSGSFLSSCRLHGDIDAGKCLARQLLKLQSVIPSPCVLLSNLYASDEMWDGVAEAWKLLKGSGLKKEPGLSLIEVKGTIEKCMIWDLLIDLNRVIVGSSLNVVNVAYADDKVNALKLKQRRKLNRLQYAAGFLNQCLLRLVHIKLIVFYS
ncbi:hypothetical protein Peur_031379 [Populus x canadensis]